MTNKNNELVIAVGSNNNDINLYYTYTTIWIVN